MPNILSCRARLLAWTGCLCAVVAMPGNASTPRAPEHVTPPAIRNASAQIGQTLEAVQKTPGSFPAFSIVIAHGADAPLIEVHGRARADRPTPANRHTLFYIASQTKSFIGLLAAILDRKGVLPLDTTLAQVWPGLKLPAPADPGRITMADLLSHQEGLRTDTLNLVTAYVRDVPAADYPHLLASDTRTRKPGFRYANLGDLVYGAALKARTGRSWRDWLDAEVLEPLQLKHVVSRTSTVAPALLSWNHQWDGAHWIALAPKPDALMHAAGGLMASSEDMATWMRANLAPLAAGGGIDPVAFRVAQHPLARADLADGEINCDGYSLGWYTCTYKGEHVLMHPGSYTGAVSVTVLVPSADAGMSLMVNSDSAMEGLELELMKAFIGLVTGKPGEVQRLHKAAVDYPARLASKTRKRLDAIAQARADPTWGGWNWQPTASELDAFVGRYYNPIFGTMQVARIDGALDARIGAMHLSLKPAQPGLFGASAGTLEPPEPLRFDADRRALHWNDAVFTREPDSRSDQTHPTR
jgi:CubicO group peptidase (beta-lactamase class C family)